MLQDIKEPPLLPGETKADELGAAAWLKKRIPKLEIGKRTNNQNAYFQRAVCEAILELTEQVNIVLTMTSSGRHDARTYSLIGMFVQTIPFVYEKGMTGDDVQSRIFDCIANDAYTLFDMSAAYGWTL
jgi:hypothetical protein